MASVGSVIGQNASHPNTSPLPPPPITAITTTDHLVVTYLDKFRSNGREIVVIFAGSISHHTDAFLFQLLHLTCRLLTTNKRQIINKRPKTFDCTLSLAPSTYTTPQFNTHYSFSYLFTQYNTVPLLWICIFMDAYDHHISQWYANWNCNKFWFKHMWWFALRIIDLMWKNVIGFMIQFRKFII